MIAILCPDKCAKNTKVNTPAVFIEQLEKYNSNVYKSWATPLISRSVTLKRKTSLQVTLDICLVLIKT